MESPPSTERTGAAAGDVIGHELVVERVIHEGSTTTVVAAVHEERGTRVAVKIARVADHESAVRFKRAARAMAALSSPYTVRVHEVGETKDGLPCAIMEYLEGRDLAALLEERGPLGIDDAIEWMLQTCEAVTEAHEAGILHRSLEPRTLFLAHARPNDPEGAPSIRVLGFDFALPQRELDPVEMQLKPGEVPGTSPFMSPEQLENRALDARVDVWGAGVCLFWMLTNRCPFPGDTLGEVCSAIFERPPPKLARFRPEVTGGLEALVARCLQREPGDRFADMRELSDALRNAREEARNTPRVPASEATLAELRVTPAVALRAARPVDPSPGAPTPMTLRIVPPIGPPTPEDGPATIPLDRRRTDVEEANEPNEANEAPADAVVAAAPELPDERPVPAKMPAPEEAPPPKPRAREPQRRSRLGPLLFGVGFAGTIGVAVLHARREPPVTEPATVSSPPAVSEEPPAASTDAPREDPPSPSASSSASTADATPPAALVPTSRVTTRRPPRTQQPPSPSPEPEPEDPILKKRK